VNPTVLAVALIIVALLALIEAVVDVRQWSTIRELRQTVAAYEVVANKRWHTIDEQAQMLVEMDGRNERLHHDLEAMRARLPQLAEAEPKATLREEPVYDLGYLSLPADVQRSLERDWSERHMGPGRSEP
jgi:hypothetical protein